MEVVYQRCCGIDVHKRMAVACAVVLGANGQPVKEVRSFETMTDSLLQLAAWLEGLQVTHVVMESTGVYWKPVWNLLEDRFTLVLANAQHVKTVPGRKTDVRDCEWLADLLRHGLIAGSYVPDREQRELRELTRYRTSLVEERASEVNRLQKTLEGANLKLASVATDLTGKSAREMLQALLAGNTEVVAIAELARGRMRQKLPALQRALAGDLRPHQRFLLARQLAHIDDLDQLIADLDEEVTERLRPFAAEQEQLDTIPGVGPRIAQVFLAEVGPAPGQQFQSAAHLASWAGMCPGNHESAGKRLSGRTRKGSPWLRTALVEAANAAGRTRNTYLRAQFGRLTARRGRKRACVAVGHTILVMAYHLLTRGGTYQDLGPDHFDQRQQRDVTRRLVRRLEALGHSVTLAPAVA